MMPLALIFPGQDAVVKGWFRTSRDPLEGETNMQTVLMTAREVASAMQFLQDRDIIHGVSHACTSPSCRCTQAGCPCSMSMSSSEGGVWCDQAA
jgi:hypothetical protein